MLRVCGYVCIFVKSRNRISRGIADSRSWMLRKRYRVLFANILEVVCRDVWIVEKPQQKHNLGLVLIPDWSSKSELLLQNPLNPGYPPRFRRSQTEVAGILGILGRRGFWDTPPSSSLECPSTTSRCGWPMASMASLGCELRKREAGQICPRRPSKDAFFLHNRSQSTEQMQRQDEDICKIEGHPQCVFSILTSSCGGVLTWRYLDVCNFPLGSFFVSLWPGPSVTVNCADFSVRQ